MNDSKTNINCLPCIYNVHQQSPYKIGLFRE